MRMRHIASRSGRINRRLQPNSLAVICLVILLVGLSGSIGAAGAARDLLDIIIKQAENEVSESGRAAAATRAKVFAREVCGAWVPKIQSAAEAKRFLDHYDELRREREQRVSEVRRILRNVPPDAEGRDLVEEGIRMALLLQDARADVTQCVRQRRALLALPNAPRGDAVPAPTAPPRPPSGTNARSFCVQYAESAQSHQQQNIGLKCGYVGSRWQANYDDHYNWCMHTAASVVNSETKIREAHLKQCRGKSNKNAASLCDSYARLAQSQQQDNLRFGCGYKGERWQAHYDNHYNWCMHANIIAVINETKARERQLQACRK